MEEPDPGIECERRARRLGGCTVAPGCRAGWRPWRRRSSSNTPTGDSRQRRRASRRACTSGRLRRGAFRGGIVRGGGFFVRGASSCQSLRAKAHHLGAGTSICEWRTNPDRAGRHAPRGVEWSANYRVRKVRVEAEERRRRWRGELRASRGGLLPTPERSYFSTSPNVFTTESAAGGGLAEDEAVVCERQRVQNAHRGTAGGKPAADT